MDQATTLRCDRWQIGGSHAQRDVTDWTLAEAVARQSAACRVVAGARTFRGPSAQPAQPTLSSRRPSRRELTIAGRFQALAKPVLTVSATI
jgi:hypothetical protein